MSNNCGGNMEKQKKYYSIERTSSVESVVSRCKSGNTWRSASVSNLLNLSRKKSNSSILSQKLAGSRDEITIENSKMEEIDDTSFARYNMPKKEKKITSTVTVVLVKAKCLPPAPEDGVAHNVYCKFRLGPETYKSKAVANTVQPEWGERFTMHLGQNNLLKISVCDKGKQKSFMGSCILDLSSLEKERTNEVWQQLDDGYGLLHLSVTLCANYSDSPSSCLFRLEDFERRKEIFNLKSNWQVVGLLHVNVIGAKGLAGKPNAYCTLEVDNERIQTPKEKASSDPTWNKCYVFNVYDITSTLDVKVYDSSLTTALLNESLGKLSIPLLRITNGEQRWYALKDKNARSTARGNCPRVCLQMTLIWNPIKASLRLFRPRPVKYVKKPTKFDVALVYSNIEFIEKVFNFLYDINEGFKQLFEWDDPEYSFIVLVSWLLFCTYFRLWTVPLLLMLPFIYHWLCIRHMDNSYRITGVCSNRLDEATKHTKSKEDRSLTGKLQDLQQMTLTITNGIEYLASVAERLYNLISFKVPFLSYFTMVLLVMASVLLYFVPFNYLLMSIGIYKFTRKYLNPGRVLNNDLLDFISRIPDNEILKDWKELSVPEPVKGKSSDKLARSISTEVLT